jgi:hypothetical protein
MVMHGVATGFLGRVRSRMNREPSEPSPSPQRRSGARSTAFSGVRGQRRLTVRQTPLVPGLRDGHRSRQRGNPDLRRARARGFLTSAEAPAIPK